jgi:hypothetical protein
MAPRIGRRITGARGIGESDTYIRRRVAGGCSRRKRKPKAQSTGKQKRTVQHDISRKFDRWA